MMKKLFIPVLAVCLMFSLTAVAQDTPAKPDDASKPATAAPLQTLKGTVKADGDKITLVSDTDQKAWDVMNPDTLKGHEGHHVQVSAHVYADKNSIQVMSVKMLKASSM
jgi:hypothetical protein